ncbi:MAG: 2Fe-2S ferredoxin [Candidatus Muproteobacteria bacterium RIFCSPHIGHO2_01_FULL_65_16]|uniref:2Fe-2S ferredoxin n=2 Tax=Candidatus Muproteobacteria TaxID=1817795 RepID=A0A1F6TIS2_9PROT|nr:MAG: 2Fe-2S ferredoxin [Candidatus Muproteobacteria bacterium RIFCSPHIGHO2_01_FULL_65_16]OGI50478.1 MAG: 2Fe-2S ferredoxin [Candidatus Muproteobacteria bacterium RIFCSPHIGHO2_02_FULL_65_16]
MSYYKYHVFFCTNQRPAGEICCAAKDAAALRDYAKERVKSLGLDGEGGVRINNSGCLGRCHEGPVVVVYPEDTWYTYAGKEDIDEIIDRHLQRGQAIARLRI